MSTSKEMILMILIGVCIVGFVVLSMFVICVGVSRQRHEAYTAWCKMTGNEKQLTEEEFVAMDKLGMWKVEK